MKVNFVYDNFIIYNFLDIILCLLNEVKYILFLIKLKNFCFFFGLEIVSDCYF